MSESGGEARDERARRFERVFLLCAVVGVTIVFFWMIRAFVVALLLAAIFSGLLQPFYRGTRRLLGGREVPAAALVVLLLLFLILGPFAGFVGLVAGQAVQVTEAVGPWVQERLADPDSLEEMLGWLPFSDRLLALMPDEEELISRAGEIVSRAGAFLVNGLAAFTRGTATFLLDLFVLLYSMFFFLRSGRQVLDRILYYLPLPEEDEEAIVERFLSVTRATIKGSLLIGVAQGTLAGLGFAVTGVPGAAFWGTIMAVLSVIPGIGAPLVWIPAVLWLFFGGAIGAAIGLTLWCGAVVSSIDNVLRPRLVGADAKMPDLLILLSTLGGLMLFGAVGFILGPIVAAVFVTIWEIYGRVFASFLPPQTESDP